MDSGAGGRCGTCRALLARSDRCARPAKMAILRGTYVHFDTAPRSDLQHGGDMDQYGDEHGR
eukprot:6858563-Lingulodinium_polyedra.AAC.1